jgi:hypothetical protein
MSLFFGSMIKFDEISQPYNDIAFIADITIYLTDAPYSVVTE